MTKPRSKRLFSFFSLNWSSLVGTNHLDQVRNKLSCIMLEDFLFV